MPYFDEIVFSNIGVLPVAAKMEITKSSPILEGKEICTHSEAGLGMALKKSLDKMLVRSDGRWPPWPQGSPLGKSNVALIVANVKTIWPFGAVTFNLTR